ncbi:MAG: DEAD/DEAH box helicase [Promethearchaeia archaeon]
MVNFEQFIKYIKSQNYYDDQISHIEHMDPREPNYGEIKTPLWERLQYWLHKNKIRLWSHQTKAINAIREDKNTVIVTSTASGKSLCYNLPVLEHLSKDPESTALYLFPTKALTRDQYTTLSSLMSEINIKLDRVGVYDGDIGSYQKRKILRDANIIMTNPYGLHYYLPWFKKKWRRVCQNLKYIVLDEIHIYRGIFGSNFAFLLRRLKRILSSYGVNPTWILCSATIKNPGEFASKLIGEKFKVINEDGSPSGPKKVILWDLPYDETSNKYRSAHQETQNLYKSHLRKNIQTLTFTLSRKMAELHAIWTRNSLKGIKNKIVSYRAGISKSKRREIEHALKQRQVLGVSSTNALELGIDIGSLDATISSGFPGTISSFKQQIGRSGRGANLSISTYVPMQNPLDLFYIHNPEKLFGPIEEEVLISTTNQYIIKNHLCCAAKESPLTVDEYNKFEFDDKDEFEDILNSLCKEDLLMQRGKKYFWKGGFYPNKEYNLTNLSDNAYEVMLQTPRGDVLLTTEDESYVFRDLHPGAVYLYEAESYVVSELDLDQRVVYISKADVNYYTQSLKHTEITSLEVLDEKQTGPNENITAFFGNVNVEHDYYSYKVIDTISQEIISRKPLENIPLIEFETQAFWFLIPFEYQKDLEIKGLDLGGGIHAIEHAMIAISPALAQISRWDLGGVSIDFDPIEQQPVIYIYDAFKGGIGIAESLYHNFNQLAALSKDLIKSCECKSDEGCPGCVMSPKCGNNNSPLSKRAALFLMNRILNS